MSDDSAPPISEQTPDPHDPAAKVRTFPTGPGVYLMKDDGGNVIYVGKAKNLRIRPSSYFSKDAANDARIRDWIGFIGDVDFIETADAIAAMFTEARLIKDIQPKFNKDLKDDKTFPYLQIRTREEFPRVEITRKPRRKGVRLYGPFTQHAAAPPRDPGAAATLPVPHLHARHQIDRREVAVVPAVPAAQHPPVHRPVQLPRDAARTTASRSRS